MELEENSRKTRACSAISAFSLPISSTRDCISFLSASIVSRPAKASFASFRSRSFSAMSCFELSSNSPSFFEFSSESRRESLVSFSSFAFRVANVSCFSSDSRRSCSIWPARVPFWDASSVASCLSFANSLS